MSFPFSDLSQAKLRPALVLADAGRGDWVLCQITSNAFADQDAVELTRASFSRGGLQRVSYARPGKLFTASTGLMVSQVGVLRRSALERVIQAVVSILQRGIGGR